MANKLKTKNSKPKASVVKENVFDEKNIDKSSNASGLSPNKGLKQDHKKGFVENYRSPLLIWSSIIVLAISTIASSSYLYFENRRLLAALDKALFEQERISNFLSDEELLKSTRKQFDMMYADIVTPNLDRRASIFVEQLDDFRNEIGAKIPTMDNIIKEFQPLLSSSLEEIENKLSLQASNRFDNLNSLTKELSDNFSLSGEMNIDLILKELDYLDKEISELKSDSQAFQEQIEKTSYEQNKLEEKFSEINSISNIVEQTTSPEILYSEVQDILSMLPDLTISAIREEYVLKTLKETNESLWGRLEAFIGSRVISRSLQPQKGNSVDAIMSRVEYALRQLDLNESLVELKGLPESTRHIFSLLIERIENLIENPKVILQ